MPNNEFHIDGLVLTESASKAYHQVVGWDAKSEFIHPCYLHCLAFPLHLMLLLLPEFPLPLLGLVHVDNQIKQFRAIKKDEKLDLRSSFGELALHPKGWLFSINVEFFSGSDLVWQSTSTNFFRAKHGRTVEPVNSSLLQDLIYPINKAWDLNTNLGRRYAKVSGDYNLIHLHKWSAKLFGFKQHVIHGMWTKSTCVSILHQVNPALFSDAFTINTTFKQPIYLPSQVNMAVELYEPNGVHHEQNFKVVGGEDGNHQPSLHLTGNICAI
ncbi:MAG: hypothetical protein JKY14_05815 [Paraglaciecola sp.]|nr:hypothetical protein [Paraglaciecola sp.]